MDGALAWGGEACWSGWSPSSREGLEERKQAAKLRVGTKCRSRALRRCTKVREAKESEAGNKSLCLEKSSHSMDQGVVIAWMLLRKDYERRVLQYSKLC